MNRLFQLLSRKKKYNKFKKEVNFRNIKILISRQVIKKVLHMNSNLARKKILKMIKQMIIKIINKLMELKYWMKIKQRKKMTKKI